jgi:chemotaxis protein methyltransferase CheR
MPERGSLAPSIHDARTSTTLQTSPFDNSSLRAVADALARRHGLSLTTVALRRLAEILSARAPSPGRSARYAASLAGSTPEAQGELLDVALALVSGETYFFRDRGQCDVIREVVLPAVLARNTRRRRLRVWSAGCSTGEEAYTLAMMLRGFGTALDGWEVSVVGTDLSERALARAREGRYGRWSIRETLPNTQGLLTHDGDRYVVDDSLRAMVSFVRHDLVNDPVPDPSSGLAECDLILCRNVTIYLDRPVAREVETRLTHALAPGGYIVFGHSEFEPERPGLVRETPRGVTIYRRGEAEPRPSPPGTSERGEAERSSGRMRSKGDVERVEGPACADSLLAMAERSADAGDLETALDLCERSIGHSPLDAHAHALLGLLMLEADRVRDAREAFRRAAFLDPANEIARRELASLKGRVGSDAAGGR